MQASWCNRALQACWWSAMIASFWIGCACKFVQPGHGVSQSSLVMSGSEHAVLQATLVQQSLPMVVVSHDREFLDQLCTKIVETEHGVSQSYAGTYTQFMAEKESRLAAQWSAYEKQQKEIARQARPRSVAACV